ncbi:hypothetical protein [Streptomyces sp. DH10]|uniref:hypothetical protein n=1 Tax=Streptomyces sp. DH10 TaxID=3040121 RepID=UPI0024432975|nr:hypothetical protein [Streptomyces sp. DH10]MDG9710833.1 hypothetical protein [Streptomyces sp. DH10]
MAGLVDTLPEGQRRLLGAARPGAERAARPMLATLSDRRDFSEEEWVFERKSWTGFGAVHCPCGPGPVRSAGSYTGQALAD